MKTVTADLSDPAAVERMVLHVEPALGLVDLLGNNVDHVLGPEDLDGMAVTMRPVAL